MRKLTTCLTLLAFALPAPAMAGLPWMKDKVPEGTVLPPTYGVGIDFFTMDQTYQLQSLSFDTPSIPPGTPISGIGIDNKVEHRNIRFDAWVLPFLNAFVVYGNLDGKTDLNMANNSLGLPLSTVRIPYSGNVYGYGLTGVYGTDHWFASLTGTWTDTSLKGEINSNVSATSYQLRVGTNWPRGQLWVGQHYIDADETHAGSIDFPLVGPVDFDVTLGNSSKTATILGTSVEIDDSLSLYLEFSVGPDRDSVLFHTEYRFGD